MCFPKHSTAGLNRAPHWLASQASICLLGLAETMAGAVKKRRRSPLAAQHEPKEGPGAALMARFMPSLCATAMSRTALVCTGLAADYPELTSVLGEDETSGMFLPLVPWVRSTLARQSGETLPCFPSASVRAALAWYIQGGQRGSP